MERRLQTQVFKSGLAKSIHHARVLIRQRHIRCVVDISAGTKMPTRALHTGQEGGAVSESAGGGLGVQKAEEGRVCGEIDDGDRERPLMCITVVNRHSRKGRGPARCFSCNASPTFVVQRRPRLAPHRLRLRFFPSHPTPSTGCSRPRRPRTPSRPEWNAKRLTCVTSRATYPTLRHRRPLPLFHPILPSFPPTASASRSSTSRPSSSDSTRKSTSTSPSPRPTVVAAQAV